MSEIIRVTVPSESWIFVREEELCESGTKVKERAYSINKYTRIKSPIIMVDFDYIKTLKRDDLLNFYYYIGERKLHFTGNEFIKSINYPTTEEGVDFI